MSIMAVDVDEETCIAAQPRPKLSDLFSRDMLEGLAWESYTDGVDVARVDATDIDGSSAGVAGWIARTSPKPRARGQTDVCVLLSNERVSVAPDADPKIPAKPIAVYHVGTGGPLFPSRVAAGEAARRWRYGDEPAKQLTLTGT